MAISAFSDRSHRPTMQRVFALLGSKRPLWEKLTRHLQENYGLRGEFKFYISEKYGWVIWFRRSGRAVLIMYPGNESFTVQMILKNTQAEEALRLKLGKTIREAIEKAYPYPEGRWLFIKVKSKRDLDDVVKLFQVKVPLPRQRRANGDRTPPARLRPRGQPILRK